MTLWLVAAGILLAGSLPVGIALQRARRGVDETVESFEAFRAALDPAVSQVQEEAGSLRAAARQVQARATKARRTPGSIGAVPNVGPAEFLVIFLVALLVFGPNKLPEIGRQVGRAVREFRHWQSNFREEVRDMLEADEPPTTSLPPSYGPPSHGTDEVVDLDHPEEPPPPPAG